MNEPKRIQRKRTRGWRLPPDTICVSRPGKWGNPFHLHEHQSRANAVSLFGQWLNNPVSSPPDLAFARERILNDLHEPRGKNLACWCREGECCHADVLLMMANRVGR